MATLGQLEGCLDALLFAHLGLLQLGVDALQVEILVLLDYLEDLAKLLNSLADIVSQVVEDNSERHEVVDVDLLGFVVRLHV